MIKRLIYSALIALIIIVPATIVLNAHAQFIPPSWWSASSAGTYILPTPATLELGDSTHRIANIYATGVNVTSLVIGGVMSGDIDMDSKDLLRIGNAVFSNGGSVDTGTTAGNTVLLRAYDTDTGPAYKTFATLTAGASPTMDLDSSVTKGGSAIMTLADSTSITALGTLTSLSIDGATTLVPSADFAVANDGTIPCDHSLKRVAGDGGAVVLDTSPAVADGTADGQLCIIQGTSDANNVQINDNVNTQLAGGSNFTLANGNMLTLVWDSGDSEWFEVSRSAN